MSCYLSRLRLAPNPTTDALKPLLDPHHRGEAMDAHHRLLWTAFSRVTRELPEGNGGLRRSAFLWRSEGKGVFHVLSKDKPEQGMLFHPPEVKEFAPQLAIGDVLHFVLRANATKTRPIKYLAERDGRPADRRVDVVMHELFKIPKGDSRKAERLDIAQRVGREWLSEQGRKSGFTVQTCNVEDYSVRALPSHKGRRKDQPQFGILDIKGMLVVTDPVAFVERLCRGFGRAKAFGCGLMMVRRA